jgi:hypothetical protein
VTVRTSSDLFAALRALGLAGALATTACEEQPAPAPARTEPAAPAPDVQAPGERAEVRRGDRHARAAARRSPRLREVTGTIVRADGRRLGIRTGAGAQLTLRVAPETRVTVAGRAAGAAVLRPGDDVRASYRAAEGGPATALSVEVGASPGEPAAPGGAAPGLAPGSVAPSPEPPAPRAPVSPVEGSDAG